MQRMVASAAWGKIISCLNYDGMPLCIAHQCVTPNTVTNLLTHLQAYASRGYISVAIDSRYHGERASHKTTYIDVIYLFPFMCYRFLEIFVEFSIHIFHLTWSSLPSWFELRHWNHLGRTGIQCLLFLTRYHMLFPLVTIILLDPLPFSLYNDQWGAKLSRFSKKSCIAQFVHQVINGLLRAPSIS